jgi:hypothetical protein
MRCLYCGKELALLKRLTGGAEFCSDVHRKSYQEEFNDLALSRLLLTQRLPAPAPAPLVIEDPYSEPEVEVAAVVPAEPPEVNEPVAGMMHYLIEEPTAGGSEPTLLRIALEFLAAIPSTAVPLTIFGGALGRGPGARSLPLASALSLESVLQLRPARILPRQATVETREFSRQAIAPAVTPQQTIQTNEIAPESVYGVAMEITNQPHSPADSPEIWRSAPQVLPAVEVVLGELARLDFETTGFDNSVPVEPSRPDSLLTNTSVSAEPTPPPAPPDPEPATKPLPVTLHGLAAGSAKPISIISSGARTAIEPRAPISSALPLRPTIILAPRPVSIPVSRPTPSVAATPPVPPTAPLAAPVTPEQAGSTSSVVRSLRGPVSGKNRRPEVRIVQAGQPQTAQQPQVAQTPTVQAQPQPVPSAPAKTVPAAAPIAAQTAKPAAPAVRPQTPPAAAPVKSSLTRSTLVSADAGREAEKQPNVDLHLPEIHNPEVMGPWARMPVAVRAGLGAVLALGIIGFAYSGMNSSNATATMVIPSAAPQYNLGKQINGSGWIEDWAPADRQRRVTLLRGSQPYSDYRIEFEAQIENKAIGWMYRGLNPKNFYVVKLEKLKPGLEPVVALVRYAVIDGVNEARTEKILPMKVRVDTTYKIRFDAVGPEFAVWVQGQKVDEWRDARLGSGGVGLYSEGNEAAAVNGNVNVFELVSTK